MSEIDQIFSYVFTWHSMVDAKSCRKCVALNGREYHDQDLFASVLIDAEYGPVWNLDGNFSLMHGASGTCRCGLEARVEQIQLENLDSFRSTWNQLERMI